MPERPIAFRSTVESDMDFLFQVYASTRKEEMLLTGWDKKGVESFLQHQFMCQHTQYIHHHPEGDFSIIMVDHVPAGRLYLDTNHKTIQIIDIALLPEYRHMGIGTRILEKLTHKADRNTLKMSLHVERNNPALNWYRRFGFEIKEDKGVYYYLERHHH